MITMNTEQHSRNAAFRGGNQCTPAGWWKGSFPLCLLKCITIIWHARNLQADWLAGLLSCSLLRPSKREIFVLQIFGKPVKKFLICLAFKCLNCPKSMRRHLICGLFWFSVVILMHFVIIHFCRLQSDSYNIPRVHDTLFALVTVWHVGGHTCRICRRDLVWKSGFELSWYWNVVLC